MIMCEKRKFLFIHIYKNAGTSIHRTLCPFVHPSWHKHLNSLVKRIGLPQFGSFQFRGHITSAELISKIGRDKFDSYFSFAFVRNPWDREVSHYKHLLRDKQHSAHRLAKSFSGFAEYLNWRRDSRSRLVHHCQLQSDFIKVGNEKAVNFVGRFENLADDFDAICGRIGIDAKLMKRNSAAPTSYQEYYDRRSIDLVQNIFRDDIEAFEYEFGS
jgi:hypothetical protein